MADRTLAETTRDLVKATKALEEPGAGHMGTLECRVDGLRTKALSTPARDLADLRARLELMRDAIAGLGPRGYLLNLADAAVEDVKRLLAQEE